MHMLSQGSAVFPIFYFPPISWFTAALKEKHIFLDTNATYRKQRYTTRTLIKGPNGIVPLVLPVGRKGYHKRISEKEISFRENWPQQHWRSILFSYKNSPYFEYYESELSSCFEAPAHGLVDQLMRVLQTVIELLQLDIRMQILPGQGEVSTGKDYRKAFSINASALPQWFRPTDYDQVFGEFKPNLSIIDLICNVGPECALVLTNAYSMENDS